MKRSAEHTSAYVGEVLASGYRISRFLASGGMATVYLADDPRHDRQVAIKILRAEFAATIGAERFLREIRVAARLTHPNILPVLDSGQVHGMPYYVMPFVEGESLRERLNRAGVIPLDEALKLIEEAADALDYAHAAGIVHRDIKPENILLLGGHAIIADFGIARAVSSSAGVEPVTTGGMILGTPAYMSPEQAAGDERLDGRSDLYSLATVLFEMLTGEVPFSANTTQALIARRFIEVPQRLATARSDVPAWIDDAVAAALSLEPVNRPASVGAFARLLTSEEARVSVPATIRTRAAERPMPAIAVLPFANLSSDPENGFLSDGITEEIMSALGRLRTLRVAAKASSFAFRNREEDVRSIAKKLGVTLVLDGSVRRSGARIRVSAQLVDAMTGFEVWSDQLDRTLDDAFAIQSDVARAIATALHATVLDNAPSRDAAVRGPAYEAYLRGRYALNKRTESELLVAADFFTLALEKDPEFALASASLADTFFLMGVYGARPPADVMPQARAAAERALAVDPSLAEAQATLGAVRALFDWDWTGADDAFRRATALGPRYSTAFQWQAVNLFLPRGRFTEAGAAIERARSLDPLSMVIATSVGVVQHLSGDPAAAVRTLQAVLELDPSFVMTHYFLGGAMRDAGDLAGSAAAFRTAIAQSGGTPEMNAGLAQTLARQGDVTAARALQWKLAALSERRHVSSCLLAQMHAALGEIDEGLLALERAASERDPELVYLGVRPAYAPLRAHERATAIRTAVGV